jgi:hypothetical protein
VQQPKSKRRSCHAALQQHQSFTGWASRVDSTQQVASPYATTLMYIRQILVSAGSGFRKGHMK